MSTPDPRSEIEEELAAHLERAEQEFIGQGMSPEAARAEALRRFGDPQKYLKSCWGQAPEARMRRAIGVALVVAVVAMGAGLAVMGFQLSRTEERLDKIMAILSETRGRDSGQSVNAALDSFMAKTDLRTADVPEEPGVVYVDGVCVKRPGVYSLPRIGELTVTRLIAVTAVDLRPGWWAYVVRHSADRAEVDRWKAKGHAAWVIDPGACFVVPLPSPGEPARVDFALKSGDHVTISAQKHTEGNPGAVLDGAEDSSSVAITGLVRNPGIYSTARPDGKGFVLESLLATAGGANQGAQSVMIWRGEAQMWLGISLPSSARVSPDGACVAFRIDADGGLGNCTIDLRKGDIALVSDKFPDFSLDPRVALGAKLRAHEPQW